MRAVKGTSVKTTRTRSGWQSLDDRGRHEHTRVWLPGDYGYIGQDGQAAAGYFCVNCGGWDGPKLKRGELTRMRRDYGTLKRRTS